MAYSYMKNCKVYQEQQDFFLQASISDFKIILLKECIHAKWKGFSVPRFNANCLYSYAKTITSIYNKLLEKVLAKRMKGVPFKFLFHKEKERMIFQTIYLISREGRREIGCHSSWAMTESPLIGILLNFPRVGALTNSTFRRWESSQIPPFTYIF